MKPIDVLRALAYPVTESAVLVPLVVFWLLLVLAGYAGWLGLYLMIAVIPAVFRYQMIVLEARARGKTPATPDIDFFRWFGNAWTLFPVLVALVLVFAISETADRFGIGWAIFPVLFASVFFPASIAVLAITQSPLQSLNPVALYRLVERCGDTFWLRFQGPQILRPLHPLQFQVHHPFPGARVLLWPPLADKPSIAESSYRP